MAKGGASLMTSPIEPAVPFGTRCGRCRCRERKLHCACTCHVYWCDCHGVHITVCKLLAVVPGQS